MVILNKFRFKISNLNQNQTNRDGLSADTANMIELCETHARLSPNGEKATS
jgi:hypothetical protein